MLIAYAFLNYFFKLVGDYAPNSDEIHLEPMEIKDVYKEYEEEYKRTPQWLLGYIGFCKLWQDCFSYVKIREFKAVTGV